MATAPQKSTARPAPPAESRALSIVKSAPLPGWAMEAIGEYRGRADVNLLLPAIPLNADIAFGHKVKVSMVQIDTDATHQEIFKVGWADGENRYALGKAGLQKIGNAAGIQWRTRRVDDRSNPDYCEVECVAGMKNESGQPIVQSATKAFSMPDVRAESLATRLKANERAAQKKTPEQIEADVEREMHSFRKHLLARTETGAILRAIRGLLGIRSQWTLAELQKPFICMRVDFQPDASDPETKRILIEQGSRAAAAMFNAPTPGDSLPRRIDAEVIGDDESRDGTDEEPRHGESAGATSSEPVPPGDQAQMALEEKEPDYFALVTEGCRVLGLSAAERNQLFIHHGGDLKAMYRDLDSRGNQG